MNLYRIRFSKHYPWKNQWTIGHYITHLFSFLNVIVSVIWELCKVCSTSKIPRIHFLHPLKVFLGCNQLRFVVWHNFTNLFACIFFPLVLHANQEPSLSAHRLANVTKNSDVLGNHSTWDIVDVCGKYWRNPMPPIRFFLWLCNCLYIFENAQLFVFLLKPALKVIILQHNHLC